MNERVREASPKRFVQAALTLLRDDPQKAQVFRVEGGGFRAVDVDNILKRPGEYVLRELEERSDGDGEEFWTDVLSTSVRDDDDETSSRHSISGKGEGMKDEGWRLLTVSLQKTIELKDQEIALLKRDAAGTLDNTRKLEQLLAEKCAIIENGSGKWVKLFEKLLPIGIGAIQGDSFRRELARRVQALDVPEAKRAEFLSMVNADPMRGPSEVTIESDDDDDDDEDGKG